MAILIEKKMYATLRVAFFKFYKVFWKTNVALEKTKKLSNTPKTKIK